MTDINIVFMGSPEFALPTLKALHEHYSVIGVVTQPDRPSGRGQALTPPPVKVLAQELGIPTIQPRRLRQSDAMQTLAVWQPSLIVVAAFGQILKPEVLDLPQFGCINVHASLLPRWRGAAPIQAAILAGDIQTGVTIMQMDEGIDTGPILSQRALAIHPDDTAGSLSNRLAELGASLLIETLPSCLTGTVRPTSQNQADATFAPMLTKAHGLLDFSKPAEELVRQVRAFQPWPGAFFLWHGQPLKVLRASSESPGGLESSADRPGDIIVYRKQPAVCTSDGLLVLDQLQPAGRKAMTGREFLQGARNWQNTQT